MFCLLDSLGSTIILLEINNRTSQENKGDRVTSQIRKNEFGEWNCRYMLVPVTPLYVELILVKPRCSFEK